MEDLKFTYKQYMNKECSHQEYFEQFVNDNTINVVLHSIGKQRILDSTDFYLNDIPLKEWDNLHPFLPRNNKIHKESGETNIGSLSDTVCIAKAAARKWRNEQITS